MGEGSCSTASASYTASHEGCTFPISNVAGGSDSHFMDASANGNNVFIATADQLLPSDTDSREDVYDVSVGGGFPVSLAPPVCVNADSCKPPVSPQPTLFSPSGSATFNGLGNFPPAASPPPPKKVATKKTAKCREGFVKKKVKKKDQCVKLKSKNKAKKSAHTDRRAR